MNENFDMQALMEQAENGDAEAMLTVAQGIFGGFKRVDKENHDPDMIALAMKYLKRAIKLGNADAMNIMGCLYYTGDFVEQDYKKAISWYKKAAAAGHVTAMCNLGYCYYYGRDTAVDMKKAYLWYSKAAVFGDHQSLYKLGDMFLNGYFVPKDENAAFALFLRAYKLSQEEVDDEYGQEIYSGACLRVARCLYEGIGVPKNLEEAGHIIADGVYFFRKRWQRHDEMCGEGFASAKELQQKIQAELEEQDKMMID